MTQAYFIIPGLLLSSKKAAGSLSSKTLDAINWLTKGASDPVKQTLCLPYRKGSTHLAWCWKVLTRSNRPFATAPYRWIMQGGPRLAGEIWRLPILRENHRAETVGFSNLAEAAVEKIAVNLRPVLQEEGFILQHWDSSLFLTRKTPWGISACETETLVGKKFPGTEALDSPKDERLQQAYAFLLRLRETLRNLAIENADSLWIDGGGEAIDFYPPTQIRSVLADDPAIIGWAQACGILNHRTAPSCGAKNWPADAPRGAVIAVLSDFYDPWIRQDAELWNQAAESVAKQIATLKEAARLRGCDEALIVACGETTTKTFTVKLSNPRSLLSRLRPTKSPQAETWLYEED